MTEPVIKLGTGQASSDEGTQNTLENNDRKIEQAVTAAAENKSRNEASGAMSDLNKQIADQVKEKRATRSSGVSGKHAENGKPGLASADSLLPKEDKSNGGEKPVGEPPKAAEKTTASPAGSTSEQNMQAPGVKNQSENNEQNENNKRPYMQDRGSQNEKKEENEKANQVDYPQNSKPAEEKPESNADQNSLKQNQSSNSETLKRGSLPQNPEGVRSLADKAEAVKPELGQNKSVNTNPEPEKLDAGNGKSTPINSSMTESQGRDNLARNANANSEKAASGPTDTNSAFKSNSQSNSTINNVPRSAETLGKETDKGGFNQQNSTSKRNIDGGHSFGTECNPGSEHPHSHGSGPRHNQSLRSDTIDQNSPGKPSTSGAKGPEVIAPAPAGRGPGGGGGGSGSPEARGPGADTKGGSNSPSGKGGDGVGGGSSQGGRGPAEGRGGSAEGKGGGADGRGNSGRPGADGRGPGPNPGAGAGGSGEGGVLSPGDKRGGSRRGDGQGPQHGDGVGGGRGDRAENRPGKINDIFPNQIEGMLHAQIQQLAHNLQGKQLIADAITKFQEGKLQDTKPQGQGGKQGDKIQDGKAQVQDGKLQSNLSGKQGDKVQDGKPQVQDSKPQSNLGGKLIGKEAELANLLKGLRPEHLTGLKNWLTDNTKHPFDFKTLDANTQKNISKIFDLLGIKTDRGEAAGSGLKAGKILLDQMKESRSNDKVLQDKSASDTRTVLSRNQGERRIEGDSTVSGKALSQLIQTIDTKLVARDLRDPRVSAGSEASALQKQDLNTKTASLGKDAVNRQDQSLDKQTVILTDSVKTFVNRNTDVLRRLEPANQANLNSQDRTNPLNPINSLNPLNSLNPNASSVKVGFAGKDVEQSKTKALDSKEPSDLEQAQTVHNTFDKKQVETFSNDFLKQRRIRRSVDEALKKEAAEFGEETDSTNNNEENKQNQDEEFPYKIEEGDTLLSIADKFASRSAEAIYARNEDGPGIVILEYDGSKYARLIVGIKLIIPNQQFVDELNKSARSFSDINFDSPKFASVVDELKARFGVSWTMTDPNLDLDSWLCPEPVKLVWQLSNMELYVVEHEIATGDEPGLSISLQKFANNNWEPICEYKIFASRSVISELRSDGRKPKIQNSSLPPEKLVDMARNSFYQRWQQIYDNYERI